MRGIFDMRGILVGVVTVTVGTAFFPIEGPALSAQQAAPDQQLSAQQAAPDQQLPAFRSGVEVVTVDVGVVDKQGRPMRGLTAADFVVTVAGQQRRVVTAEFVERAVPSPSTVLANADAAQVSTNEGGGAGRLYAFIVDQNTLDLGSARRVAGAAAPFFSRLTFADRSALMLMPLGPNVSFTWAHDRVREGLQRVTGMGRQTIGLGVRQPGGRARHHESQPDGPPHPGRAGVRHHFGLLGIRGRGLDVRFQCGIPAVGASGVRRRNGARR